MPTIQTATDYVASLLASRPIVVRRGIAKFRETIQTAIDALAAGSIPNAAFKELMFTIGNRLDEARDVVNHARPQGTDWMGLIYMHQMAGRLKKTTDETERTFLTEVLPIAEMMMALKPLAVKRQPKPAEDVQMKYLAPRAGNDAVALVQKALMQVTDAAYQRMFDQTVAAYHEMVAEFNTFAAEFVAAKPTARSYDISRAYHKDGAHMQALRLLREVDDVPADKLDARLRKIAKREVDYVRDQFLIKNLKKLDSVVEAKGDFVAIEIIGYHFSMVRLEGNFHLSFKDGASFAVTNTVETAYSIHGKRFYRFPLRFHDVVMTGGVKMAQPSEQRMNEIFAKRTG